VGTTHQQYTLDRCKTYLRRWRGAVGLSLGDGLPALAYRTPEEQGSGGSNQPTGGNHRPEQPVGWPKRVINLFKQLGGDVDDDPDVRYAYDTVEKAQKLDRNLTRRFGGVTIDYDVFGPQHRRTTGERK
jgi:hypothetical protein